MLQFSRSSYLIWDWSYGLSTKGHAPWIWTNLTLHKTIQRFKPGLTPFFHGSLSGHEIKSFTFIHHIHSIPSNVVTTSFDITHSTIEHSLKDTFTLSQFNSIVIPIEQYSNKYTPKGSAICVQRFDDSQSSAIRITYRISLRSSSNQEPRYPSHIVINCFAPIHYNYVITT